MSKSEYNMSQLNVLQEMERSICHRDRLAHYFRWQYVMKRSHDYYPNMRILDWGCGDGNLLEMLYRNRLTPKAYLGLDVRKSAIEKAKERFGKLKFASFVVQDLVKMNNITYDIGNWDMITCFEVAEHIQKKNGNDFFANIARHCSQDTVVLLSTPVYDAKVGAANNHTIHGEVAEWEFDELKVAIEKHFHVVSVHGTFASKKDFYYYLGESKKQLYDELHDYYTADVLSILMAPLINPRNARNCVWELKLKAVFMSSSAEAGNVSPTMAVQAEQE